MNTFMRCMAFVVLSCISAVLSAKMQAQVRVSGWQTYSSMLNVRTSASDKNGVVWAGTSGGVFSFNPINNEVQEFRNVNALLGLDISTLAVSPSTGEIFAGGFNGVINVYDGKNWRNITDILTAATARKQINNFVFVGELVFVGGEFGLTVLDPKRNVFNETVQRFSTLQPNTPVKQLLIAQNRIWAATDGGVVSAPLGLATYVNPSSWTLHPLTSNNQNLTQQAVTNIAVFKDTMYAVQDKALWKMRGSRFDTTVANVFEPIRGIQVFQNQLHYASQSRIWRLPQVELLEVKEPRFLNSLNIAQVQGTERLVANSTQSFAFLNGVQTAFITLNSPANNRFRTLTVDTKGGLWCASGAGFPAQIPNDGGASGFSYFANEKWSMFNAATYPQMPTNAYYQLDAQPNGSVWASSWGRGVLQIEREGNTGFKLSNFTNTNSTISVSAGSDFVVVGQVRTDARGVLSIPNFLADSLVVQRDAQGRFYRYSSPTLRERQYVFQTIDQSNTKWFGTWRGTQMLAFNDGGTPNAPSDDTWYATSTEQITEGQSCLVADKQDYIWVGTPKNLYTILNPSIILNKTGTTQRLTIDKNRLLADQTINAIAVDALNYKWIGTNNGVWVLDEQGGTVLQQFTTQNSPLASNSVFAVAIDDNSGKVYFGTDNGLSVAQTLSVRPNTDFTEMRCFPQPFIPQQDTELIIDGLAENSQVKISTVDGVLVRSFPISNSRTVVWNGLDELGRPVQSGVFIISAYSDATSASGVIKAMVIQK
jgi:ligand-binding sensor domain-containing protein